MVNFFIFAYFSFFRLLHFMLCFCLLPVLEVIEVERNFGIVVKFAVYSGFGLSFRHDEVVLQTHLIYMSGMHRL